MELSIRSRGRTTRPSAKNSFVCSEQSANSNLQTDFQRRVNAKTTLGSIIVSGARPMRRISLKSAAPHLHNNEDHTNYQWGAVLTLGARMQIRNSIKSGRLPPPQPMNDERLRSSPAVKMKLFSITFFYFLFMPRSSMCVCGCKISSFVRLSAVDEK
jgi:hypothetical protein